MATLDDILTTQKNGVVGINNLNQNVTTLNSNLASLISSLSYTRGQYTSAALTSQTLVTAGAGYLVSFTVNVAGSAAGTVNNSATTGAASASNVIAPTPTTIGTYHVGSKFSSGLVVSPGTGQTIVVTYSLG